MQKVQLGDYIERVSIKASSLEDYSELEALGVSNVEGITKTGHVKSADLGQYLYIEENYFAYNPYRINVGSIGLTPKNIKGLVSPAYIVFKTKDSLKPELLFDFLKSFDGIQQINKLAKGTVRKTLSFENLSQIELIVPDIEKQEKILDLKLKTGSIHIELENEISNQQNLLTKLKQSILQEAIEGKLTANWREQNQDIEPASILLEKIQAEKEQLIKEKKIKKSKPLAEISEEEIPFEIPDSWKWSKLGLIGEAKIGLTYSPTDIVEKGTSVLRSNNIQNGKINYHDLVNVKLNVNESKIAKINDILLCARNGSKHLVGKSALITQDGMSFGAFMSLYRSNYNLYIYWFLQSNQFRNQFDDEKSTGISQLTQGILNNIIIPFPPIEEQKEIIKQIEKLFAICDELEEQINNSKQNTQTLMQAVLKEAFEK